MRIVVLKLIEYKISAIGYVSMKITKGNNWISIWIEK